MESLIYIYTYIYELNAYKMEGTMTNKTTSNKIEQEKDGRPTN